MASICSLDIQRLEVRLSKEDMELLKKGSDVVTKTIKVGMNAVQIVVYTGDGVE